MKSRGSSSRHRARELALQVLYAVDLGLRRPARSELPLLSVPLDATPREVERTLVAAEREVAQRGMPAEPTCPEVSADRARVVFDGIAAHFEAPPGARELAWEMVSQVCASCEAIDLHIASRARNWRVSRMAAVDRNILRLGTWELGYTTTPIPVILDEAVELARRYGSDASPAFVNGILDALAVLLRPDDGTRSAAGDGP